MSTKVDYEIIPRRGVGLVNLGDDRADVRELLGPGTSAASPLGCVVKDRYWDHGLVLSFNEDEKLVRIAVTDPAQADFAGIKLLGRSYEDVLRDLRDGGHDPVEREAEIYLPNAAFGAWTSAPGNPSLPVSAVVIYESPQ
jgi:hypothetical protein